jgi:hypothetical protein
VFPAEPELNEREIKELGRWLAHPEQLKKLTEFLHETLFDLHKIAESMPEFARVRTDQDGDTYINIRIPVSRRIARKRK